MGAGARDYRARQSESCRSVDGRQAKLAGVRAGGRKRQRRNSNSDPAVPLSMAIPTDVKRQALEAAQGAKTALKVEKLPARDVSDAKTVEPVTTGQIPPGYGKNLNRAEPTPEPDKE